METRKFTVRDTRVNNTVVFESTATTVAELKRDLRANGINPDGMAIQEGLTRTEFMSDDAVLPHDVAYRGGVTNNLVFRLTQKNKKIASGVMSRADAYRKIKELHLEEEAKKLGRNYTQLPTDELEKLIMLAEHAAECSCQCAQVEGKMEVDEVLNAINTIFKFLVDHNFIEGVDGQVVIKSGDDPEEEKPIYTEEEIDEMFED